MIKIGNFVAEDTASAPNDPKRQVWVSVLQLNCTPPDSDRRELSGVGFGLGGFVGILGRFGCSGLLAPIAADLGRDQIARVLVAALLNVDGIALRTVRVPVEPDTVHPSGGGTALTTLFGLRCHASLPWDKAIPGAR